MADQSQTLRVPLSRGLVALIDPEDAHLLAYTWHALKANRGYYAVRNCRAADGRRGTIYMHREILGIQDPCIRADHKSGDRLDNRRANLRAVTVSVNGRNRGGVPSNNNSGHLGVTWCPRSLRWRAYIGVNGRTSFLGVFRDLQEAVKARARAELTHWGVEPQREAALKAAIAQEGA